MTPHTFKGVLLFHSETGTEGGHWAFQDERFMGLPTNDVRHCTRCGRYWDRTKDPAEPAPSFTYWHANESGHGNYRGSDVPRPDLPTSAQPGDFNDEFTKHSNATSLACYENGHEEWRESYPDGIWSYEGLHVLRTGDHLKVFVADEDTVLWEGDIDLSYHPLFTQDASGMWIHSDQQGVERGAWAEMFFAGLRAELTTEVKDE